MRDAPLGFAEAVTAGMEAQRSGLDVVIVTIASNRASDSPRPGARMLVGEDGAVRGSVGSLLDPLLVEDARRSIEEGRSSSRSYALSESGAMGARPGTGEIDVFFELLAKPPKIIVVGGGHIALPLVRVAKLLDFEVVVVDDRPQFASSERFPDADEILVGPYRETLASVTIHRDTHVVLVTRGHVHDQSCLELVLDSPAAYIGMIGSRKRVRTVMQHLKEKGYDAKRLERVYAPIGLDIAAETPSEIALAIMAEITNVRRGGKAASLALKERLRV